MEKNVTITRANSTITVKVWDNIKKAQEFKAVDFSGVFNDTVKKSIRKALESVNCMVLKFYEDTITVGTLRKYAIPESEFFARAIKMDKRPQGDYISRTGKVYVYTATLYNGYTDDIESVIKYSTISNEEKARKAFNKEYKDTDKVCVDVTLTNIQESLYVMPVSEFIERATIIE